MKKVLFTTIVLLFANLIFAQINLTVNLRKCYLKEVTTFHLDKLLIYKDGALFKQINYPRFDLFSGEVPSGKYTFQYTNVFQEVIRKKIVLAKKNGPVQEVILYADELQDSIPKNLFFQRIKNGQKIVIKLGVSGCFASDKDSLIVYKEKNNFFLVYNKRRRELKPKDICFLMKYENELRHLKKTNFMSTGNGTDEIIFNSEKIVYVEPSMYWDGFRILKAKLKLK